MIRRALLLLGYGMTVAGVYVVAKAATERVRAAPVRVKAARVRRVSEAERFRWN